MKGKQNALGHDGSDDKAVWPLDTDLSRSVSAPDPW
jgi:hypothetical protein